MLMRRRFSRTACLLFVCITVFVFIFYKISKLSTNSFVIENCSKKSACSDQNRSDASTDFQTLNENKYSQMKFNPFRETASNVNQIMMAYSYNNFSISSKRLLKKILFWNDAYGSKDYGIGFGRQGFRKLNCPIDQCFTTANRNLLTRIEDFDAIVFHLRTFHLEDIPEKRNQNQRYILWSLESPQYNMQDIYPLNGFFNWTMTYRIDSDVVQPYGWIQPKESLSIQQLEKIKSESNTSYGKIHNTNKKKLVAWFVSNCQSKSQREKYAQALGKFVQLDIYGDCGTLHCSKGSTAECYHMLQQNYKFYLSFENSFCDDYVTEKFFSIMNLEIVPIVFGGANYSSIAPLGSYIDAGKFQSAQDLANYLKILDANDTLYFQYFWWKPYYQIRNNNYDIQLSMCGLCARLHYDGTTNKIYNNLDSWWILDSHCKNNRRNSVFRIPFWNDE